MSYKIKKYKTKEDVKVTMSDISDKALEIAKKNAKNEQEQGNGGDGCHQNLILAALTVSSLGIEKLIVHGIKLLS